MSQRKAHEARRDSGTGAKPESSRSSRRSRLLIGAAALAVAALVGVGLLVARGTGPAAAVRVSSGSGIFLSGTDPITGKAVSLADYAGKPVVLNTWASWCTGCAAEAADLRAFVARHPQVQVVGLDTQDTSGPARAFYRRFGWRHPSISDPNGTLAARLGLQGLPTTFFLDRRHRIVTRIVGATDLAGFDQGLKAALAGA